MNDKNIKPDTLREGSADLAPNLAQFQEQIKDMQMKIVILKEIVNILKKTPASIGKPSKTRRKQ